MASTTINSRVKLLHDTQENWNLKADGVLMDGEAAVIHCQDGFTRLKIGNGSSSIRELDFIGDNLRRKLINNELIDNNGVLECQLMNYASNNIIVDSSETPLNIILPPPTNDGFGREFNLRIEVRSGTAPTCSFSPFGGGVEDTENIDFECSDSDWNVLKPGINMLQFTEHAREET